jgi:hypothetical protein
MRTLPHISQRVDKKLEDAPLSLLMIAFKSASESVYRVDQWCLHVFLGTCPTNSDSAFGGLPVWQQSRLIHHP